MKFGQRLFLFCTNAGSVALKRNKHNSKDVFNPQNAKKHLQELRNCTSKESAGKLVWIKRAQLFFEIPRNSKETQKISQRPTISIHNVKRGPRRTQNGHRPTLQRTNSFFWWKCLCKWAHCSGSELFFATKILHPCAFVFNDIWTVNSPQKDPRLVRLFVFACRCLLMYWKSLRHF